MYRKTCEQCERMVCARCNCRGHMDSFCPDLWRRYHQTLNSFDDNVPKNIRNAMKPSHQLFCCNCAKRGHDSADCRKYRWSQHFPNPAYVVNYNGPTYYEENDNLSRSMSDSYSNSYNSSTTYDTSFNFDSTYNNSISYNTAFETTRNLNESINHPSECRIFPTDNMVQPNNNVIFKITSKFIESAQKLKTVDVKLNVLDRNYFSNYSDWRMLSKFLNEAVSEIMVNFSLEQTKRYILMIIRGGPKYMITLTKLIQQYANRNNFERSHLYLDWIRDSTEIGNRLIRKLNEMKTVTEDPLDLYNEAKQLSMEIASENQSVNNPRYISKRGRLVICQRKLLMILYREGAADDSLKELRTLNKKINSYVVKMKKTISEKQRKSKTFSKELISINCLLKYTYHYNNVFVPHEPKNLDLFIQKYKEHLHRIDRLQNNPVLFPPQPNISLTCSSSSNSIIQNTTLNARIVSDNNVRSSNFSSQVSPLLPTNTVIISQIPPLLPVNTSGSSQIPSLLSLNTSITSNFHISQEQIANTSSMTQKDSGFSSKISNQSHDKNSKSRPNPLCVSARKAKGKKKENLDAKFRNLRKKAKKLLEIATRLNAPHLQKDLDVLKNKVENAVHVSKKDMKPLRQLVDFEINQQKRIDGR